jgi:hypothetical protein
VVSMSSDADDGAQTAVRIACVWCTEQQLDAVQLQICNGCRFAREGSRNLGPLCRTCCDKIHGSRECSGTRSFFSSSNCGNCEEMADEYCQDCVKALCTVCGPAFHDTGNVAFEGHVRIKLAPLSAEGGGKFAGKFSSAALPIYGVLLSLSVNQCLQRGNMACSCCCCSVAAAAAAVVAAAAAQSARPSRFDPLLQLQRLMPSLCIVLLRTTSLRLLKPC